MRVLAAVLILSGVQAGDPWVVYEGSEGPGKGKHIVFVTGDDEYRSEEGMPMMARLLARRHGFTSTVLFAIDPKTGAIKPDEQKNIPGLEKLAQADLMVLFTRFRQLPDEQMKHILDYAESGRPIVALRTATHPFNYAKDSTSPFRKWSWNSREPGFEGGFGRKVLGETWVSHHGAHNKESTRGVIAPDAKDHPLVRGCGDIWGPTDVYGVRLPADCKPIVLGQVVAGMKPGDPPVEGRKNNPMMPVAWTRSYAWPDGKANRIFVTTLGASQDLESEGLRRLLVNACYWALGLEVPEKANVEMVGGYAPTPFGFGTYVKGVKPADLREK